MVDAISTLETPWPSFGIFGASSLFIFVPGFQKWVFNCLRFLAAMGLGGH
jgi:hypothetical protein